MAILTINIPDDQYKKVVESFSQQYGYTAALKVMPQPQTPDQFLLDQVNQFIFTVTSQVQSQGAAQIASQIVADQLSKDLILGGQVTPVGVVQAVQL